MPVITMMAIMKPSIVAMAMSQRFSVRATISPGTMPSEGTRSNGSDGASANGTSRHEQEEIEG
jgi:hypothetical protein